MKFKIDENLPSEIASQLRSLGYEADTVQDEGLTGAPDSTVLAEALKEKRTFLTLDKGVANIQSFPPARYSGIILFRPPSSGRNIVLSFVLQHLPLLLESDLSGHLFVVSDRGVRKR